MVSSASGSAMGDVIVELGSDGIEYLLTAEKWGVLREIYVHGIV
jgi:hypothetical protein